MWRRVALIRTDISGERIASIIRVETIIEVETTLTVSSKWIALWRNTVRQLLITASVVPSLLVLTTLMMVLTRSTRHRIPEDGIPQVGYMVTSTAGICIDSQHWSLSHTILLSEITKWKEWSHIIWAHVLLIELNASPLDPQFLWRWPEFVIPTYRFTKARDSKHIMLGPTVFV
jgi:hypothetical protein